MSLTPRQYQLEGIASARAAIRRGVKRLLLVLATGGGKCLGLGTPVLRYDGTIIPVEQVMVGDMLMGPDSCPRLVLSTVRGSGQLHRIVPLRGRPWICNDAHVLTLVHTVTGKVIDVDLPTYLNSHKTFRHVHKQFSPPDGVDFATAEPLPLDPYFVGLWYGDGTKRLAGVAISKPDPEVQAAVEAVAQEYGLRVRTDGVSCPTHHVVGDRCNGNALLSLLRRIVGDCKRLPHAYLTASRQDREAFLAGLLDSDGYLHHNGFEVAQVRNGFAEGIVFLAQSLGLRALSTPKIVNGTTYHRVSISGDCSHLPLRIPRKIAHARRQKKVATRTGFAVEPLGTGEYAGFELDGDGRFLLGDFTVTHNTVCAAQVALGAVAKGKRVLFLAHRREIVLQARAKLLEAGIPDGDVGTILASAPPALRRPNAPVQVASVQTLANRPKPPADVLFVDEAHHAKADTWEKLATHYREQGAVIVGLTATPCRQDGRGLGDLFEELLVIRSFAELAAEGYLVVPRVYSHPHTPDLSGVKTSAGDYQKDQIAAACDKPSLVGDLVEHWLRLAEGRTTAVFAAGVEHSRHIVEAFRTAGVAAEHLDCETPTEEREAILARMASGETRVVSNMGVLTEGWDLPRCKCVVLARPTRSLALYLQMAGRGLRPWEDTPALLLDHAGCALAHGLPQEDREWSLEGTKKQEKAPSVKICPRCYLSVPRATLVCPGCGHSWESEEKEKRALELREGELRELTAEKLEETRREKARKDLARAVWLEGARRAGVGWARTDSDRERVLAETKALNLELYRRFGKRDSLGSKALREALAWVETACGLRPEPTPVPVVYHCQDCGAPLRYSVGRCYACSFAAQDVLW